MNPKTCFYPADIYLPDFTVTDGRTWSCVACDQYTSQPDYWETVDALVGSAPSTLRLMLPEVWLDETAARTPHIHAAMNDYLQNVLVAHPDRMVLVERTLADGKVRIGLVGAIDLEAYDYRKGASSLIRATEQTVPERIPPRMTVRRGAPLELPHVMLLIDDRKRTVIEPLYAAKDSLTVAYDYDLMQSSGHLKGYWLDTDAQAALSDALADLITPGAMEERYGRSGLAPLLFAVGDGNHSLASAKACWEEVKATLDAETAKTHPARYALVEVVNLYDASLEFEPIYRVLFGVEPAEAVAAFADYAATLSGEASVQVVEWKYGTGDAARSGRITIPHPVSGLAVGTVQDFLDAYLSGKLPVRAPETATVDYIHGEDTAAALSEKAHTVAFLYAGMAKEELFATVISDGALPRKTFSMGHAADKRFYTEARKIR